jgi:hypothetical protein
VKTFIELEVLRVETAIGYKDKEPEHKSEVVYLERSQTQYGEEVKYKKIKSMLAPEEHEVGYFRFEVKVTPYLHQKTNRPELSIKILGLAD